MTTRLGAYATVRICVAPKRRVPIGTPGRPWTGQLTRCLPPTLDDAASLAHAIAVCFQCHVWIEDASAPAHTLPA